MFLLGAFPLVALILAVAGIYGVIAYSVTQRTREIGIQLALGADPNHIMKLVVRQGLILAFSGIGAGLVIAPALTRVMKSLLFEITADNPFTFVGSVVVFASAALLTSYWPARRATRIDPASALRVE